MKPTSSITAHVPQQERNHKSDQGYEGAMQKLQRWWLQGSDIIGFALALTLVTISLPGREGGDADLIGIAKIAVRLLALGWFALDVFIAWGTDFRHWSTQYASQSARSVRENRIPHFASWLFHGPWRSSVLWPWIVFASWSLVTVLWSPLKGFSIGQWLGLAALLLFASSIELRFRSGFSKPPVKNGSPETWAVGSDWRRLFLSLQLILSAYCLMVMIVYCISPDSSGLNREILHTGGAGLVHPTAAGATSALAILLGALAWLLRLNRRRWLIAATMPANLALLLLSTSRGSMLMLLISLVIAVAFLSNRLQRGVSLLVLGATMLLVMIVSPNSQSLNHKFDSVTDYVMRGQSTDDLKQVSGRSEMWSAIWKEFEYSPLIGHGYYVTSRSGEIYVWGRVFNHDAHNIFLQSLVSSGIVGCALFIWALWRSLSLFTRAVFQRLRRDRSSIEPPPAALLWCVGLVGLWYVGWSQTCTTFLGPIRPESVVFYAMLGLFAATQSQPPITRDPRP